MNSTSINWTDRTWNPVGGCEKVSEGCQNCYAESIAEKFRGGKAFPDGFGLTLRPHKLSEPLRLRTPSLIFVNSMSDLFWEQIPDTYRDRMFDIIEQTPRHEYQVLTKRPEKMLAYAERRGTPYPANFWGGSRSRATGTSVAPIPFARFLRRSGSSRPSPCCRHFPIST